MNDEMMEQMKATAERLAGAAEALDRVLERLNMQQESLTAKVKRIVAAVKEWVADDVDSGVAASGELQARVVKLERANADLKAQAMRMARKTLPSAVSALLSKNEVGETLDSSVLDKMLQSLNVEQRIAVKAEMARVGIIE